jgi:phosphoglycolate phosphatase
MIGVGAANLVREALPEGSRNLAADVLEDFRRDYFANYLVRTVAYPGIEALLAELSARGVPMCVLSNKPHAPTCKLVAELFSSAAFLEVAGDRPARARKPDPAVAVELAARMGLPPSRCGFVGDSGVDMRTARAAGMRALGVTWGFRERDELLAEGADALIEAPHELLAFVDRAGHQTVI